MTNLIVVVIIICFVCVISIYLINKAKTKNPKNNVHFYIQRNKEGIFHISIGRLVRDDRLGIWVQISGKSRIIESSTTYSPYFESFNLSFSKYKHLRWEDEPVEVFLNMDD